MKKLLFVFLILSTVFVCGCKTSKSAQNIGKGTQDVWQTMLVKQLDCLINDNLITVSYNNGTTLYYTILDNYGHVALTWDHTGRTAYDEGESGYKGIIDIPSFVTSGEHDEFLFQVIQIDENAFYGCTGITAIQIPYSIGIIRMNAFKGCNNLKEIKVNENNMNYIDIDGVLFSKDQRMLIQYPAKKNDSEYELPQNVSFICPDAFNSCESLTKVTIGNEVTAISDYAFMNCTNLQELRLGKSVRIIGVDAFKNCPKLSYIYSPNIFPPHNCPTVFDKSIKQTCKVTVPKGQKWNYSRQLEWNEFLNISEEW